MSTELRSVSAPTVRAATASAGASTTAALDVLLVSMRTQAGGAERVAHSIHEGMRLRGHRSTLVVGERNVDGAGIQEMPVFGRGTRGVEARKLAAAAVSPLVGRLKGAGLLRETLVRPGAIRRRIDARRGRDSFAYPGSRSLLDLLANQPDVVHCHNLHGGYFDLRTLRDLGAAVPLALSLHDEWAYTGHCGGTLGCERWRTGCGACPDLTIYPAIAADGTAANHRVKRAIYRESRFHVSAPSDWLLERAKTSILAAGALSWRLIRNGVDLEVYRPGDRDEARAGLGLPRDAQVLVFAAYFARHNRFKDIATVLRAARDVAAAAGGRRTVLVVLGDAPGLEMDGELEVRTLPFEADPTRVATLYQAADVLVHAAFAEVAGLVVIEAMACGIPVVATAVGGIPESVRSLSGIPGAWDGPAEPAGEATGVLVRPGDASGMARAVRALLDDAELRPMLSVAATARARQHFSLNGQLDLVESWYREMAA